MKKHIKKLKTEYYDDYIVSYLSQNKERLHEIESLNQLYEEIEIDIPEDLIVHSTDEIEMVNILLDKGLEEYEEGIFAGVAESNLYEFDFIDKSVTISLNLIHTYVFLFENKRVWFSSDLAKNNYLYANYETGEILNYIGDENNKTKLHNIFDYNYALKDILKFTNISSLSELFKYYFEIE